MKLGLGSYAYAWSAGIPGYPALPADHRMDVFAFVQRAAELGLALVQIADNLPLHTLSDHDLDSLVADARARQVAIEVGTRGIHPDHLRRYLSIARICHSPIVRVVIDTPDHHPDPDEVIALLRETLPEFAMAGVTLAIENHDRFPVRVLARVVHDLEPVAGSHIGICLDTANSFGASEGINEVVEVLGPLTVNLHLKDYRVRRLSHNLGFIVEGAPAGQGDVDVPWLLKSLGASGRCASAILELWAPPEPDSAQSLAALQATIAKEASWVLQSLEYLKPLFA